MVTTDLAMVGRVTGLRVMRGGNYNTIRDIRPCLLLYLPRHVTPLLCPCSALFIMDRKPGPRSGVGTQNHRITTITNLLGPL